MKLVILGRDSVINAATGKPILKMDDWQPVPGSREAISRLHRDGYRVVVVSNQPAIGTGQLKSEALNRIHVKMMESIHQKGGEIEAIFFCPHTEDENCRCRMPKPGLFEEIAERLKINLTGIHAVGATLDEVRAARSASALPVLLRSGGEVDKAVAQGDINGVVVFDDLAAFVDALLLGQVASH